MPGDGFWSFTVYDRDGYFEPDEFGAYGINDVTAKRDEDGSVTIDLAPASNGFRHHIYMMDGWNEAFRLCRPRAAVLDGTWQLPPIERVG